MDKKDIKNLTLDNLKKELKGMREPVYRATQIFHWIYKKGVNDFNDMANIPKAFREKLGSFYYIGGIGLKNHFKSKDGTEKFVFELSDGNFIEAVLIKSGNRNTLCLSTQVGCKYACRFCASGSGGFIRNLEPSEILGQILFVRYKRGCVLTNFVFMGMGEPLDNYDNVLTAIKIMHCSEAMAIGARRITVSTCGIIPGIEKLASIEPRVNLSISMHAANDRLRSFLMPVNRRYTLEKLIAACERFSRKTGRLITIEYTLIKGKNDASVDARGLSRIAWRLNAKVNLIAYSAVRDKEFEAPSRKDIEAFKDILVKDGVKVTVRESKGGDIQAACGQLVPRNIC